MDDRRTSRRLSYVLRHAPESIGVVLDEAGWVDVDVLLEALGRHGLRLTRAQLDGIVARNDKQRFALDDTGRRIRASQGHSVAVDLGYAPQRPPDVLFHGTPATALDAVLREGLHRRSRHAVHLSEDVATAHRVGARRGEHVVLEVDARTMADAGHRFTRSANGVWLVEHVPPEHLTVRSRS